MDKIEQLTVRHLQILRELDRTETWTEAADTLGVAQSTVSAAVRRLEEMTGTILFEPDGVRRVPTRSGARLTSLAQQVLPPVETTWEAVTGPASTGVLRVGVIDAVPLYLADERLPLIAEAMPGVEISLVVDVSERLLDGLVARELDVVIVTGPEDRYPSDELFSESLRVYGAGETCVLYPEGSRTRGLIDDGLRRLGIEAVPTGTAMNPAVLRELARLGRNWTVLPEGVASAGDIPLGPMGPVVATRSIVAVRRAIGLDPLADRFVELALESALGS